jgi:uncharacterized protein YqjF (DUF2071 family)
MMDKQWLHEGILVLGPHRRYCICEAGLPPITLTSGCPLEIWLNREWISGCVEGDGQDYWLFVKTGGKFLLAERMMVRYREPW